MGSLCAFPKRCEREQLPILAQRRPGGLRPEVPLVGEITGSRLVGYRCATLRQVVLTFLTRHPSLFGFVVLAPDIGLAQ